MTTLLEMLNASEVREDDENFKNAVDLMFDALENATHNILRCASIRNTKWRRAKQQNRS